jgi:hypothetical protein
MIKELSNLKVKAIAVNVPDGVDPIMGLIYGVRVIHFGGTKHIALPPGTWTILGRANELKSMHTIVKNDGVNYWNYLTGGVFMSSSHCWQSYCTANNLTNQLILIQQ